jgi:hypothetical protein
MAWEIGVARILPGWLLNLYRAIRMRPYPDPKILSVTPAGGAPDYVDFVADVVNHGTQHCRVRINARIGSSEVRCHPAEIDLVPQATPKPVRVFVPREELGNLVKELDDETTLYGETLRVEIVIGEKVKASREWREKIYDEATDRQRFGIQQRKWRIGRSEETPADLRAEYQSDLLRRADERPDGPSDGYIQL